LEICDKASNLVSAKLWVRIIAKVPPTVVDQFGQIRGQKIGERPVCPRIPRGVKFRSLTEAIDTDTPTGRAMWQMIGLLAGLERSLISERPEAD